MTRKKKCLLFLLASSLGGAGLLFVSTSAWGTQTILLPLVRRLSGIDIHAEQLRLFRGHTLETKGLRLALPNVANIALEEGSLDVELFPLLRKEYRIRSLHIKDPKIELLPSEPKKPDEAAPPGEPAGTDLSLKDVQILEGTLSLPLGKEELLSLSKLHLRSASCETEISCELQGEVHVVAKDLEADLSVSAKTRFNRRFQLDSFLVKLESGKFHFVRPEAAIEDGTLKIEVSGKEPLVGNNHINVQWTGLQWQSHKNLLNGELESTLNDISGNKIGFQETRLSLKNDTEEVLSFRTNGEFDKATKHLQVGLELGVLKSSLFRFFASPLGPVEHLALHGAAKADLEFQNQPQGAVQARLTVDELSLANSNIQEKNLSQTSLEIQAELKDKDYEVKTLKFELQKDGSLIYDLNGGVGIKLPLQIQAHLHSSLVNAEALRSLQKAAPETHVGKPEEKKSESALSLAALPAVQLEYEIERLKDKSSELQKIRLEFASRKESEKRTSLHSRLKFLAEQAPVEHTLSAAGNEGEAIEFTSHLSSSKFPIAFLLKYLGKTQSSGRPGEIESLLLDLKGKAKFPSDIQKHLQGSFQLSAHNNQLPSSVQDVFPFNLIFLPLGVVSDITGKVTGFLIPDGLSSLASDVRKNLSENGRIVLDETEIELEIKDEVVKIKKGIVSPDVLPGIEYTGTVGLDGDLDLRVFLKLLGIRTPLPITGTTNLPLPNVVRFIPELVKGLGLSALDVVEGVGSVFETEKKPKKK